MLRRHLLPTLCLFSLVAYFWPWAWDPFTLGQSSLPTVIVITMFSLGCLLPVDEVQQIMRHWPLVLGGTVVQYVSMPLCAWIIASVFPLSDELRLGIIMVGCVPGAMASNALTLLAQGNVSYSLMLTTSATCLSPIAVPVTLSLAMNQQVGGAMPNLVLSLSWMVLLPVVAGHLISWWADFKQPFRPWGETIASLAILWIIAVVVGVNRERIGTSSAAVLIALLVLNLAGYFSGWVASRWILRLDPSMTKALILEIGMQNAGLGTALALQLFADQPAVMIPTAVYTFGCMLTGSILAQAWARQVTENGRRKEAC